MLTKFLKSNLLVFLLSVFALWLSLKDFSTNSFLANPLEYILLSLGKAAVYLLLINCYIPFIILVTPKKWRLAGLKAIRRPLGVICYLFAFLHVTVYVIGQPKDVLLSDLTRFFIINGLLGFLILSLMAFSSNNLALKKLGKKLWKALHRLVYLMLPILFLHISAKDKGNIVTATLILLPLFCTYLIRFFYYYFYPKIAKRV